MARDRRAYSTSRRRLCWASLGVLVAPRIAIAQASKVVRRIGVLDDETPNPDADRKQAEALRELGWIEGKNLQVDRRYANERPETLRPLAEELVRAKVEIIVTWGTPATLAAKHATTTIPIIFGSAGDPVPLGLVASLARPGGNITGYSVVGPEVTAKQLAVIKELLPGLARIGALSDMNNPYHRAARGQFENACRLLGLAPTIIEVGAAGEIGGAISQLERQGAQILMLPSGGVFWDHRFEIVDIATKHGLPIMADNPTVAREAGALIGYNYLEVEQYRVLAEYIDRILRGARPADLPVRQPTMFELVINLKTARSLGLTIPKELLLRADEVIQ